MIILFPNNITLSLLIITSLLLTKSNNLPTLKHSKVVRNYYFKVASARPQPLVMSKKKKFYSTFNMAVFSYFKDDIAFCFSSGFEWKAR